MQKFLKNIIISIFAILLFMFLLDVVYTKVYETAIPRTKFQYLRSLRNKKVDFIFIGSSRVENGIVPSVIYNKTGKTAVNLGVQAAKLGDIFTLLRLTKEYKIQYEKIFIQVDYIYNIPNGFSNVLQYELAPFVRENDVIKKYFKNYSEFPIANYYFPFYRYCVYDSKIGFREVFANVVGKRTNVVKENGYVPRYGNSLELQGSLPKEILEDNEIFDKLQIFIKKNKMNVVYYCAPFCINIENKSFISKLKEKIPGLLDLSGVLKDDKFFLDCNHLNNDGAKRFTDFFVQKCLVN